MHPARLEPAALEEECVVTRTRRSGPGGQHRNKVETAVVIVHTPTGVRGEASERRFQAENLSIAWHRLRVQLAVAVRAPWNASQGVSPLWHSRVRGGRIAVNAQHDDFGPLLAEALDVLAANQWIASAAATHLGVTTTQFIKLLRQEPRAYALLEAARRQKRETTSKSKRLEK